MKKIASKAEFLDQIEQHQGIINSLCSLFYEREEDRKDARQDIILQLWKAWPSFRGESKVSTWIYKVALNTLLAKSRKEKRRIKEADLDSIQLPDETKTVFVDDDVQLLRQIIELLPDDDKALVVLYLEGYKNIEIATILGLTQTNISTRLHRIKTKLRQRYQSLMYAG